jgi:hypothetical protein
MRGAVLVVAAAVGVLDAAESRLGIPDRGNANVSLAAEGKFVAAVWSGSRPDGGTDIYAAVSRDAGERFEGPVGVNSTPGDARVNGEQPPRVALVAARGKDPDIVVVWTAKGAVGTRLMTSRSTDGGRSFGPSTIVPGTDAAGHRGWEAIAADPRGAVYAAWLDHRQLANRQIERPEAMAQLSQLHVGRLDGKTPAVPVTGGVCYCCKTALASGRSGELYVAWRHVYPGNLRDIAFATSRDAGRTFDPPVRVSEDGWAIAGCPDDGPAMAVAQDGWVHVVWPTVVTAASDAVKALFHSATRDGRVFTPRARIPTWGQANHPQVAVSADGALLVVWDESGDGSRRLAAARGALDGSGRVDFKREDLSGAGQAIYPAAARVDGGMVVAWTSGSPSSSVIRWARLK